MNITLTSLEDTLKQKSNPQKAKHLQKFFKTGPGEYAEGDIFLGITVPEQRKIAKLFQGLTLNDTEKLLSSPLHEARLTSLLIMIFKFSNALESEKEKIFNIYMRNTKNINNWDLVDLSAPQICGRYLHKKNHVLLFKMAQSPLLWDRRISIISTFYFIKNMDFVSTIKLSKILINDKHDLMHKAVGWMLREIGKRNLKTEEDFLKIHYKLMPRTMLRYAIEKFPENKRQAYLKSQI